MFIEKKPLALLLMCIILAGCATATYTSLVSESFAPSAKDPEVFFVAPDRPFQIIGLVEARGSTYTTHAKLIKLLKAKARKKALMQFMYHLERNRFLFIALSTVFIQYLVNQEHML